MARTRNGASKVRRRVVITGLGCVTPLGAEIDPFWHALLEGRSGVGPITQFDASQFPVRIAAEVRDWPNADFGNDAALWQHQPRQTGFAMASAIRAYRQAGLDDAHLQPDRFGIYLGCGETFLDFGRLSEAISGAIEEDGLHTGRFMHVASQLWSGELTCELDLNLPAALLAGLLGAQGPTINCIAACATGTQAIGEAAEIIRRGEADVMLSGGAHSMIHPFGITGFYRLSALSTRNDQPTKASRPFDRQRDGFVVGEGAAMLVLEELQHARRRGAQIWGELTGYGNAHDAFRLTDPHPQGQGAARCMARALADAGLRPDQIDYINAHGTATKANDRAETTAIKAVFGPHARRVAISSTKSMIGHCTTAAGAVELVPCLMAIREQVVHPTMNLEAADPECDLDYVPNAAREIRCRHVLSNSFGFGGQNAALIISRFDG